MHMFFSEGNVEVSGKKVYLPIYKLDLSGLMFDKDM